MVRYFAKLALQMPAVYFLILGINTLNLHIVLSVLIGAVALLVYSLAEEQL